MQKDEDLQNVPPAAVFTCGFNPLRDVGVEYSKKLKQGGNEAPWSSGAMKAAKLVGKEVKRLAYSIAMS